MSEVLYYAGGRDQHVGAYVFRVRNDGTFDLLDLAPSLSIRAKSPTGGGAGDAHIKPKSTEGMTMQQRNGR